MSGNSSNKETTVLILALGITAALLAGGFWWFSKNARCFFDSQACDTSTSSHSEAKISLGESILIDTANNPHKQTGIEAFKQKNFSAARQSFHAALKTQSNDPETLIYWNNAIAASQNPLIIAVSVPIGKNLNVSQEILRGVAQAQNEINQRGGIQDRLLQCDPFNLNAYPKKVRKDG